MGRTMGLRGTQRHLSPQRWRCRPRVLGHAHQDSHVREGHLQLDTSPFLKFPTRDALRVLSFTHPIPPARTGARGDHGAATGALGPLAASGKLATKRPISALIVAPQPNKRLHLMPASGVRWLGTTSV